MNCIWLYDHEKGEYIQADWNMAKQAIMPFSRETLALARRVLRDRGETISGQSILREANRIMTAPLTAAEKRAKSRQATPLVPPADPEPEAPLVETVEPTQSPLRNRPSKPAPSTAHLMGHFDEE
jgi:hypothetical protein